jgi:hypothetical protein
MDHTTDRIEKVIDELTGQVGEKLREWAQEAQESESITLGEMEREVREGLHTFGGKVLQKLVDLVGTGKTEAPMRCPVCDQTLDFVRYQGKWVETLLGTIRPERAYFYCPSCGEGHVPLDHQLGLGADSLSGGLEEAICMLAPYMPLEEVADKLQRLMMVEVDDNTIQRSVIRVGSAMQAQQEQHMEQAWQAGEPPAMEVAQPPERLYISVDGTKVHLREGWREVKVAALYETTAIPQPDGTTDIRAVDITYVVSFEKAETFARYVYLEAARRGLHQAGEVIVLGDGAEWIWNHITDLCDKPLEILDFYHASLHVAEAGEALYGDDTPQSKAWVDQRLEELREEGPGACLASLWQATGEASASAKQVLAKQIGYLNTHKHRMHYPELRAAGYHIGSGSVESACKRIIGGRLKQSGMIWSREGAEAMAHLRAAVLSGRWDQFRISYDRATCTCRRAA